MGMEQFPEEAQLPVEDEFQSRISLVLQSPPHVRENFYELAKCSKGNTGNKEIMEMLVSMKKEMEERERRSGNDNREEEFLKADLRRKEQRWEQLLNQREEEWRKKWKGEKECLCKDWIKKYSPSTMSI